MRWREIITGKSPSKHKAKDVGLLTLAGRDATVAQVASVKVGDALRLATSPGKHGVLR